MQMIERAGRWPTGKHDHRETNFQPYLHPNALREQARPLSRLLLQIYLLFPVITSRVLFLANIFKTELEPL